jgi:hypothetical protein
MGVQHGYSIDTGPLVTFVAFSLISCPPNYLWQSWMESTFPGYTSPDDAGTVESLAQQPQVKAALDAAAPTLQRIEETAAPVMQKASAATTALSDSDIVKNARRRASEGVDAVKAKAKELEARAGINQAPMAETPTRSQTFSTSDGQAVEKKIDTTFAQPPASSKPKALSIKNTAIKFALDQTFGAAANNALFIVGIAFLKGQSVDTALSALHTVCVAPSFGSLICPTDILRRTSSRFCLPVRSSGLLSPSSALPLFPSNTVQSSAASLVLVGVSS